MHEERNLDAILSAGAIQVVDRPKVVEVAWEPCTDELGAEALEVFLVLDDPGAALDDPSADLDDAGSVAGSVRGGALQGTRSIWEALLLRLYESGDGRFPYVSFRSRRRPAEDGDRE